MRPYMMLAMMLAAPAWAAPVQVKNGRAVRVVIGDRREPGVAVRPNGSGWRLVIGGAAEAAEIVDVTKGSTRDRWHVPVVGGALILDGARFVAAHAYRVELRRGTHRLGEALVYLYPPVYRDKSELSFDGDEEADDSIATMPKSAL